VDVITTRSLWRHALIKERAQGRTIGFVPTMGALHAGHRALVEQAVRECDVAAVSIFVNPLQFGSAGDLAGYPRDLEGDCALLEEVGAAYVFAPEVTEIYPDFPDHQATSVHVEGASLGFEGADRPGHFDGMATIVAMLFSLTGRAKAYFGEKDIQQLCVVQQMVADLAVDIEVIACPTVRHEDGLALSSRNARLSHTARQRAAVIFRALSVGGKALERGATRQEVEAVMASCIAAEPEVSLSYACVVETPSFTTPNELHAGQEYRLILAGELDGVRLIDNIVAIAVLAP
jgi:pantoate--beta-alanine ligase